MPLRDLMSSSQTEEQRRFVYLNLVQPILQTAFTSLDTYFQQIYRILPSTEQVGAAVTRNARSSQLKAWLQKLFA